MIFRAMDIENDWEWMRQRARPLMVADSCGIIAEREGEIQACAVFDSFTVNACSVHLAIDNPFVIRHGFLHEIARYLFVVRGRTRIFGMLPADNEKAIKLDKHIGMEEVARIPNAYAEGIDYIIMHLAAENCRWLLPEHYLMEAANG